MLWMETSKLILNPDKTYLIIIGTKQQRNTFVNYFHVKLLGNDTSPSNTARNMGVVFDFSFHQNISQVYKYNFAICVTSVEFGIFLCTADTISVALISRRLDYCNSLINTIAKKRLRDKLQRVHNCLARWSLAKSFLAIVFRSELQ